MNYGNHSCSFYGGWAGSETQNGGATWKEIRGCDPGGGDGAGDGS